MSSRKKKPEKMNETHFEDWNQIIFDVIIYHWLQRHVLSFNLRIFD